MAIDPRTVGLIAGFVNEAQELCQDVTRDLLEVEKATTGGDPLEKPYASLARGLHTLKGSAATLGMDDLSELAHAMEDVVAPVRKALRPFPSESVDDVLKALDAFMVRLRAYAGGRGEGLGEMSGMLGQLRQRASVHSGFASTPAPAAAKPDAEKAKEVESEAAEAAAAFGEDSGESQQDKGSWRVDTRQILQLMREVERLREVRLRLEERRREMEKGLAALTKLGLLSETVETRALMMSVSRALQADAEETADIVDSLEDGVKAICTLPVRTILEPLHRAVRDLCRAVGKEAKLSVVGGEVSLDRRVLEVLRGPLVHLIRNALDHGIEKPEERKRRGKHHEGALVIRVEQVGNMVFIEVSDDGNGLDVARIREVTLQRGLVPPEELARMDAGQVHELIFYPGFSTSRQITETSGRGVGLDVVRTQVQSVRGHVDVQSIPGQGTRFILTLPADLGSSPVLVVRLREHQFGIPLQAIETAVAARRDALRIARTQMKIEHREQLISLQDMGALMGVRQPEVPQHGQPVLIVQAQGQRMAITVDEVIGDRDLVIRPLPNEVRNVAAYQGAATMARGELILVVRADWLVGASRQVEAAPVQGTKRALVVDDSLTARALHRAALEVGGYTVHALSSARQALDQLRRAAYDVIVCDIGMEEMDGFAFTRTIRSMPETNTIPVILVSAHDTDTDRKQGLAAGADGFLSKKDCAAGRLLSEVSNVIARRRVMA